MYYIQQDEKIVLFDTEKERLINTLAFMPQYEGLEILETERPLVLSEDGTYYVFADTDEYLQEQAIKAKQQRIDEIKAQLTELDQKRIRALCEPSTLTNESNQTWLEYYNNQVLQLREELQSLLGENKNDY